MRSWGNRLGVSWAEGGEFSQVRVELLCDVLELYVCVNVQCRLRLLWHDVVVDANTGTVNVGVTLSSFDAFSEMFVTANPV